jgi:hypothetical protein
MYKIMMKLCPYDLKAAFCIEREWEVFGIDETD